MFYLDPNTNKRYTIGTPFEYNGVYYTMQGATHAKFMELGFTQVIPQQRPDDRFYYVTGPDSLGQYTSSPRPLDDLKTQYVLEQKKVAHDILRRTDWYVVRLLELGAVQAPVPANITTYRAAVRTVADSRCGLILSMPTVAAFETLMTAPEKLVNLETGVESVNPAALTPWPTELETSTQIYSGY